MSRGTTEDAGLLKRIRRVCSRDGAGSLLQRALSQPLAVAIPRLRASAEALGRATDRLAFAATAVALSRQERQLLARNRMFENCHRGRRCFVIGNGPSIKRQDLAPLAGEVTFALSAFWKHPIVEQWQPTYYCIYDPLFFDGSSVMSEFFANLRSRVHGSTFFVPLLAWRTVRALELLPLDQTYYVAGVGPLCRGWLGRVDLTRVVDSVQSVSQLALMAAIYMGCSPIYLVGMDHDWLAHLGPPTHFYEGWAGLERHPEIRPTLREWGYRHVVESQLRLWDGYEALTEAARVRGLLVLNATNGGFLDVFERVRYEAVVGVDQRAGTAKGA